MKNMSLPRAPIRAPLRRRTLIVGPDTHTMLLLSLLTLSFLSIPPSLTQTIGGIVLRTLASGHSTAHHSSDNDSGRSLYATDLPPTNVPLKRSSTFPLITGVSAMPFKINKNTVEMLNKGLTTLIGIKRLLTTIRSVNELSLQAFPSLASKPRIGFIMKLINGGKLPPPHGTAHSTSQSAKRNPSLGLIKIGEKPPPGLFPETMPFTMNGNSGENGNGPPGTNGMSSSSSSSSPNSPSKSVTLSPIELFAQLGAAAASASSGPEKSGKKTNSSGKKKRPLIITKHNIHEFQQANNAANGKPFFEGTYEVFQNPHL